MTFEQENAYIAMALHDIEDKRGPQRESVQVFREFWRAVQARTQPKEVNWGTDRGIEVLLPWRGGSVG